jgi:hypothetical protein
MPLKKGGKKAVSFNIRELHNANKSKPAGKKRSHAQMIAIGISAAKRGK